MTKSSNLRDRTVDTLMASRGVCDCNVLQPISQIPREECVDEGFGEFAYLASPLPIGEGQTISQSSFFA